MNQNIKTEIFAKNKWLRFLFMVLYAIFICVAHVIMYVLIPLQFLIVLFTGKPNKSLLGFGKNLSTYIYQIFLYLTYNSETKPFPFGESWPT